MSASGGKADIGDPGRWLLTPECLVDRPQSRRCQFQKVTVRIAEIEAAPPALPIVASFDGDSAGNEMFLPTIEFVLANGERHMQHAITSVTRNGPAGQNNGLCGGALAKDQEDIASGHRISSQSVVAKDRLQPECALVEGARTHHVLGMDRSFQDTIKLWHEILQRAFCGGRAAMSGNNSQDMMTYVVLATFTDQ